MDEKEFYSIVGYVKISKYRELTLRALGDELKMPSELAREIDIRTSQVSSALADMKKINLVVCVNEEVRKGRLYKSTDLGKEIINKIDNRI